MAPPLASSSVRWSSTIVSREAQGPPPDIVAGLPLMAALAPLAGGVKTTLPPFTGSTGFLAVTVTEKGVAKAVLTRAL